MLWHLKGLLISKLRCQAYIALLTLRLDYKSASCTSCCPRKEVAARAWNRVKGFTLLEELDKESIGWSLFPTLGACIDKYWDVFSCPKVSQKLEFNRSSIQTQFLPCAGLKSILRSFRFELGWTTKWTPNDLQLVLLEIRDLNLEYGDVCRKLSPLDHLPQDKRNRACTLIWTKKCTVLVFALVD